MKIRHKQSGVVLEGQFTEREKLFIEVAPQCGDFNSTYSKAIWEEVKPVWKDVTAECEVILECDPGGQLWHHGRPCMDPGYRLRKVHIRGWDIQTPHAFIIEAALIVGGGLLCFGLALWLYGGK